ncbi:Heterokaryon incompatibility [Cordyceps fumosorosea ARSEF 2679]|uniref:Heterokaryon incompatibility n=1 Tax=Cordyceps fumosorosea (strain ARSEF 2679) TaxID=1081104 RepID=A0A168D4T9_CORFA|nr:Heterokaryon incompatibility [Cordyceps fumosorosea ARSEF 2679]OAA72168.1 Heterokaryon incompatibility [Cordyceps fumosorosea ARSEF 2679]
MRLLNASTLALEEFFGSAVPEYAILSHRWLDGEVSLQDLQAGRAASKAGYAKIQKCCAQTLRDGLAYAWVDTCCIDKTSSAELSEALNSMYAWYRDAALCYAFLSDVPDAAAVPAAFEASAWFTRGWTLQELLAPAHVVFYDAAWEELGTRDAEPLTERIALATRIDADVLRGEAAVTDRSVAQRMAWAASRVTTRPEDRAYSLLGLFGVSMPTLYGEGGARAFRRLQEEIMKDSDDQSLFAWDAGDGGAPDERRTGLLAHSPADFAGCADVVVARQRWNHQPYSVTNRGLALEMPVVPWGPETFLAALDCENYGSAQDPRVGIYLRMLPEEGQYARVRLDNENDDDAGRESRALQGFPRGLTQTVKYRKIYVRQTDPEPARPRTRRTAPGTSSPTAASSSSNTTTVAVHAKTTSSAVPAPKAPLAPKEVYGFYIRKLPVRVVTVPDPADPDYPLSEVYLAPGGRAWDDSARVVTLPPGGGGTVAALWVRTKTRSYALKVGFDADFNPVAQYGGMLSSPGVRPPIAPNSPEAILHPSWMTVPRSDYLFRGDRRAGGLRLEDFPWRVRITHEVVLREKMWVLDIEDMD